MKEQIANGRQQTVDSKQQTVDSKQQTDQYFGCLLFTVCCLLVDGKGPHHVQPN